MRSVLHFATTTHARHSRLLANTLAAIFAHVLDPWTPTLKREPFSGAFGKKEKIGIGEHKICIRTRYMMLQGEEKYCL